MTNKIFFIGEIGINHNGSVKIAKEMINMAKNSGFDAVKFQKRNPEVCVPKELKNIKRDTPWGIMSYKEYKEKMEFGKKEYDIIDDYCKRKKIEWFASSWDLDSQKFLDEYNLLFNKIASPMITNMNLVKHIAKQKKYTFISTGMSDLDDVEKVVKIFKNNKCPFMIIHSVSIYPCPEYLCNIKMIEYYKNKYGCDIGYSGHEEGLIPSVLSAIYDVSAIERHITLDRAMWGTDQSASLEKRGQEYLIRDAKSVKMILGNGINLFHDQEKKKAKTLRWWNENDCM